MSIKVFDNTDAIDGRRWNSLSPSVDPDSRYESFQAMERSSLQGISFYYLVNYDESGRIQGILPAYRFEKMPVDIAFDNSFLLNTISFIRKRFRNFLKIDLIFAGNPLGEANRIIVDSELPQKTRKEIALNLILDMEKLADSLKIDYVAFKDFEDSSELFTDPGLSLKKFYHVSPGLPNNILINKWKTFNEYLSSLKHSQRRNILRNIRIADREGLKLISPSLDKIDSREIFQLYLNTYNRAKIKFEFLNSDYFINMLKCMNLSSGIILANYKGKNIGFLLYLFDENVLIVKRIGIDYNLSSKTLAYFRLFYRAIETGIERGVKQIILGQQSYASKHRWGAEISPTKIYFRSFNKVMDRILANIIPLSFSEFSDNSKLIGSGLKVR